MTETRILVDPERVVRICDYMLRALDHLAPAIEARCGPIVAAYKAAFAEVTADNAVADANYDRWLAAYEDNMAVWESDNIFFRGKEPKRPKKIGWRSPPIPPAGGLFEVGWLRYEVESVRSCGRIAVAPYEITASEARRLDRWESGVVIDRLKALLAEPAEK